MESVNGKDAKELKERKKEHYEEQGRQVIRKKRKTWRLNENKVTRDERRQDERRKKRRKSMGSGGTLA